MAASRGHALRNYIIRRLLLMIPTFLGVTILIFGICQFVPGGPIEQAKMRLVSGGDGSGESGGGGGGNRPQLTMDDKDLESLREYYGFDKPPVERYFSWLWKLVRHFDFGTSFRYSRPAILVIADRLPVSLFYGLITTVLVYMVCIPLGILKAIKHRTAIDNASSVLIFVGYAVPGYALGAVLLVIFAVERDWFPLSGFMSSEFDQLGFLGKAKDLVWHAALPLVCYMIGSFAFMTMLMKNSLMENMAADYVKTALSKGLSWPSAVFGHAVRNSLIPLATSFGNNISLLLTGSVLIERVFNINGVGMLTLSSLQARDYPVVMGIIVIGALLLMVGNLLSDLCVAFVDPRVRFE